MALLQVDLSTYRLWRSKPYADSGDVVYLERNVVSPQNSMQSVERREGMRWLKTLKKLWKGEHILGAIVESRDALDDARKTLTDVRACLDGENGWFVPPKKEVTNDAH